MTLPIFPLHAVLFPGGPLALRIFEPRYLDMIGDCMRNGTGFGVCLIKEGRETGEAASTFPVGTFVRIDYWHRRCDGLLGITVIGERRFVVLSQEIRPNHLITAEVELFPPEPRRSLPRDCRRLAAMLEDIMVRLDQPYRRIPKHYDDAGWVAGRLAELLPLPLVQKQHLLQLDDPVQRLERLRGMVDSD